MIFNEKGYKYLISYAYYCELDGKKCSGVGDMKFDLDIKIKLENIEQIREWISDDINKKGHQNTKTVILNIMRF